MIKTHKNAICFSQFIRSIMQARVLHLAILSLLVGCSTAPVPPANILTSAFLPENNLIVQFKTTSSDSAQASFESWVAQTLDTQTYSVAMTNQDEEFIVYTLKDDGLYLLYPQAGSTTLILPHNAEPGMSWTDAEGVTSTLIQQFYYRAPDGNNYHCIEIKIDYPATATHQAAATQTEFYAEGLGLVKTEFNDPQQTVKSISALSRK